VAQNDRANLTQGIECTNVLPDHSQTI